jgi:putative redox protein
MPSTTVQVRNLCGSSLAIGSSGSRTLTIDRSAQAGGEGQGFNGGELLLLALGACYSNDLFREADTRAIKVRDVRVSVSADWGGDPVIAQNVILSVEVDAEAGEASVQELMEHTYRVAEIPNSLRLGAEIKFSGRVAG